MLNEKTRRDEVLCFGTQQGTPISVVLFTHCIEFLGIEGIECFHDVVD